MKVQEQQRTEENEKLSIPVAAMTGLWRRGILRVPGSHDRRRYVRIPTNDPAQVNVIGAESKLMEGRVVDVSRGGLRLRLAQMFAQGTKLRIQLRETGVLAEVRYCVAVDGEYDVGVQIQSVL
jgi:hypothetical protein